MIIFTGNFLNEAKLRDPITIIHEYSENTNVGVCSVHELSEIEKCVELYNKCPKPLKFAPYSLRGYIKYCKPEENQMAAIKEMGITLSLRRIEKIPENNGLVFHKSLDNPT